MGAIIKDIAQKAQVSTATVSNVLTGKKFVSQELTLRVNRAIEEMGYRPNCYARGLKTNRSYMIGIQIPDIMNPYFSNAVKTIQTQAAEKGYGVILYNSGNVLDVERHNIDSMLNARVDGMICVAPRIRLNSLIESVHIPMVVMDRLPVDTNRNVGFVYADNYHGGVALTEYLINRGYQDFVYLAGPVSLVSNANERLRGVLDTLDRFSIGREHIRIYYGEFSFECGQELMKRHLEQCQPSEKPTAVFGGSDVMAWGAMETLKSYELKIPENVAVVGYDNVYFSAFLYPALTTMENPVQEMSLQAANMMLNALVGNVSMEGKKILVKAKLIERQSA